MIRVVVCWEDRFHDSLDRCLRRMMQHARGGGSDPERLLFFDDARGNGGFVKYVRESWPILATKGLPKSGGAIDHLVCIADADRAEQCCGADPAPVTPTFDWLHGCDEAWTERLRRDAPIAPERVHGRFLRWSKESLVLTGHDLPTSLKKLGCRDLEAARRHLDGCAPSPSSVPDDGFADRFRRPERCIQDVVTASGGIAPRKGQPPIDDAIDEISRHHLARLATRAPELVAVAALVNALR